MTAPPGDSHELHVGDILAGRYRLTAPIGEGGMGFVWEARHLTTDKAVAIKVLKRTDAADAARFLREARVAAALSHRNIVQVFDFWEVEGDGPVFMVMELLRGQTLADVLEDSQQLTANQTLVVASSVAAAVRAAHAQKIVHRDLKPENVFFARSTADAAPEVKVLDFGLAKPFVAEAPAQATALTQTGSVLGTPYYMAPEQVYGEKDIDGRADVWALGVIVYECLTGKKPFTGENFGQIFRRLTQGEYPALHEAAPNAPPVLIALVNRMMAHDRAERPAIEEVHDALAAMQAVDSAGGTQLARAMTQRLSVPPATSARPSTPWPEPASRGSTPWPEPAPRGPTPPLYSPPPGMLPSGTPQPGQSVIGAAVTTRPASHGAPKAILAIVAAVLAAALGGFFALRSPARGRVEIAPPALAPFAENNPAPPRATAPDGPAPSPTIPSAAPGPSPTVKPSAPDAGVATMTVQRPKPPAPPAQRAANKDLLGEGRF